MKKSNALTIAARVLAVFALSAILFSFREEMGGDSFTIYLNDKLLVEQYVAMKKPLVNVALDPSQSGQLSVYYSHCGKIGTGRGLALKDERNALLKDWKFPDAQKEHSPMLISVKDLAGLLAKESTLRLVYYSAELPEGRQLVNLQVSKEKAAVGN